jgi:protein-S-isoprenylcysteine O-methyltransferase Ste14
MFVLARALTYATLFVGSLLVFLPAQILDGFGLRAPADIGLLQYAGLLLTAAGSALALSCILAFVVVGKGTPAPFDPPRRLVVSGPYRWVRNPMYLGTGAALLGAALYYRAVPLLAYAGLFLAAMHVLVRAYEEPTLRDTFGTDYDAYCHRVGRWWPRLPG